jgi:HD-GYP domain-containing protein (c-di-GMP phosphodiesterase class II)
MRLVPINCIRPGSFLSKDIYDSEGRVLLAKGVELTPLILNKVKYHGIMSLYIQDEYSENEIEDIIQPQLRQKAIRVLKDYFNFSQSTLNQKGKGIVKKRYEYIQSIHRIAENIVEEILAHKNIMVNLVDIKCMDNYTYSHCVNVAILSLVLSIGLGLNKKQLYDIAVGAMLHDIGKIFIPKEILNKEERLTKDEYRIIQRHSQLGYDYLKDLYEINSLSRIIVLQHHEAINGKGYPSGLTGERIHLYAKIVAIADNYDALTSDRPYRRGLSPNEAIEYIMASGGSLFDYDLVKEFINKIIPYPIGTLVRLSNGCIASVESVTPDLPLRPKVRIVRGNHEYRIDDTIDLFHNYNIVILGEQYEHPFDEDGDKAYA